MSSNIQSLTYKDLNNLARYATGATINHTDVPPFEAVGGLALFEGGSWLWSNRRDIKGGFRKMSEETAANKKIMQSSQNIFKGTKEIVAKQDLVNFEKSLPKNEAYNAIRSEAQRAIRSGNYGKLKELEELKAVTDYNVKLAKNAAQPAGKIGKTVKGIKDKSGITKLTTLNKKALANSSAYRSASKLVKGGGGMALISAAIETPNVYQTYKTLGTKAGNKQLAKSAVNVAAETAGWIVGAKAGASLGAAIGSVVPGVGTAVGAVIGVACGLLGSWVFGKASRAIVGKDELEIAQEEQADQLALEAEKDPELKQELALAAAERLASEGEELSEDGKIAAKSLDKVIQESENTEFSAVEPGTQTQKKYVKMDSGLEALYALAGDSLYSTSFNINYSLNPQYSHMYNGFNSIFNNPFMVNNQYMFPNQFQMNYFNPFFQQYNGFAA